MPENVVGLKVNQLDNLLRQIQDDDIFVVGDPNTGEALQCTGRDLKDAISVAPDFHYAETTTVPTGAVEGTIYFPQQIGTYANFLNAASTALTYTGDEGGLVFFLYTGTYWVKVINAVNLSNYISKTSGLQNSLVLTSPGQKAIDAGQAGVIASNIFFGTYTSQTLTKRNNRGVNSNTGIESDQTEWRAATIPVTPGQKFKFTAVLTDNLGIAGFDAAGVFLSTLDSSGLPIGNLYNNKRHSAIYGTTLVTGRVRYTNVEITIPNGCYQVIACSAESGSPSSTLTVLLEDFSLIQKTLKQAINENILSISSINTSILGSTDVTGAKTTPQYVSTADGTLGTSSNTYEHTDFITIRQAGEENLDIYVLFSGSATANAGFAGYDNAGVFLSDVDTFNKPIGALWDLQRYAQAGNKPAPINNGTTIMTFQDVLIKLPSTCWKVRGTGLRSHSALPGIRFDCVIKKRIVLPNIGDKVQTLWNNRNSIDGVQDQIDAINFQLLGVEDITGPTNPPNPVSTLDGNITGTPANIYRHTDLITVREVGEEDMDIYLYLTGIVAGRKSTSNSTGCAGYDNSGAFLSTIDEDGLPLGNIWDYDRWIKNGSLPVPTIATAQTTQCFTDVRVKIPATCWKVRNQGADDNANIPGGKFPVAVKKLVYIPDLGYKVSLLWNNSAGGSASVKSVYDSRVSGNVIGYSVSPITGAQPGLGKRLTLVHFSDNHYGSINAEANHLELNDFVNKSECSSQIDAVVFTGDISQGTGGRTKATTMLETTNFATNLLLSDKPVIYCPGNHDDNVQLDTSGRIGLANVTTNAITKTELYNLINHPIASKYGKLATVSNKLYSYQDFAEYGVRIIALDRYEVPIIDDGGGTGKLRYTNQNQVGHYYSQAQLDWLSVVLSGVPAGYAVLVLVHGSLNSDKDFSTALQGWSLIPSIINAWVTGGSYNHSYTHPVFSDMNTSKIFDFSVRGTGEFITYLSGHIHSPFFGWNNTFNNQRTIVIPCLKTDGAGHSYVPTAWGIQRDNNQELKNSFQILSIDRTARKIFISFYGAHKDLYGNIQSDTIILDY